MSLTKHKIKILYEKVLVVKSIHNSKDSLKKVWKLQIKIREFDFLARCSGSFLCYLKLVSFLCYLKLVFQKLVFMLFALMFFGT